jgi:hypothetical protein
VPVVRVGNRAIDASSSQPRFRLSSAAASPAPSIRVSEDKPKRATDSLIEAINFISFWLDADRRSSSRSFTTVSMLPGILQLSLSAGLLC